MRRLRALLVRLFAAFGDEQRDHELAEELESHLQMHTDENVRQGMPENEARRQALIRLGGLEQTKQVYRERRGLPGMETLWQDVRFGLRMLMKNFEFTLVAVLTLTLGIGMNTMLFSVIHAVLLNPLPYPHPEELVTVHASKQNFTEGSISYPNFRDWQRENKSLEALAVSRGTGYIMTGLGSAEEVRAELVSSDFFPVLGVKPALGRLFAPGEDEIGRGPVAMISAGLWKRKFGGRADVIGKALTLDGRDYTVVGVLPESFYLAIGNFRSSDIYVPIGQFQNPALKDRAAGLSIHGIARLKPGVSLIQAQADMEEVSKQLEASFPGADHGIRAKLIPFRETLVRDVRPLLLVLMGAVGFVLLIACVNVANLLLARSNAREQEFAVRSALGAGRTRLLRQLLTESLMLSVLGVGLAEVGLHVVMKILPRALPRAEEIHLSWPVLCFTVLISLASGTMFGLAPALKLFRQDVQSTLKAGGRGAGGINHRLQDSLVVVQMSLALVLLIGAGLMIRSLAKLSSIDPGFRPEGMLMFGLQGPVSMKDAGPEKTRAWLRESQRRIAQSPDVAAASFSWGAMPMMSDDEQGFWLEGETRPASENAMKSSIRYLVGADYLKVMGIPLLKGRFLTDADDEHAPRVVVVDDVFARKFFGEADPIGKRIHLEQFDEPATIVGVVGHVNQWGLDNDAVNPLRAETYQSILQLPDAQLAMVTMGMDTVVRSKSGAAPGSTPGFRSIENAVTQMDREQVVYNPLSMQDVVADTLASRRFAMILLMVFAGTALLLASIGMYGVISYVVGQRSREIGIRMALGAERGDVLRWILGRGGRLAMAGAAIGLVAALGLGRWVDSSGLLYSVRSWDPWTFLGVTALMMGVALSACFIPARRATRIDPMKALRTD